MFSTVFVGCCNSFIMFGEGISEGLGTQKRPICLLNPLLMATRYVHIITMHPPSFPLIFFLVPVNLLCFFMLIYINDVALYWFRKLHAYYFFIQLIFKEYLFKLVYDVIVICQGHVQAIHIAGTH